MVDKISQLLPKETTNEEVVKESMRPSLSIILGTLDLMREGVFDNLDQEKKKQLIDNAFMSAQKLNGTVNNLKIIKKARTEKISLARFSITLLKEGARTILPQL